MHMIKLYNGNHLKVQTRGFFVDFVMLQLIGMFSDITPRYIQIYSENPLLSGRESFCQSINIVHLSEYHPRYTLTT